MWQWLKQIFCGEELERLEVLEKEANILEDTVNKLNDEIYRLNNPPEPIAPEWLDESKTPYQPKVQVLTQSGGREEILLGSKDIYTISPALERLVKIKGWETLSLDRKLYAIWEYVCKRTKYTFDHGEAWNFPVVTYYRKKGDCEDTTILFVVLCRLAGVPSDGIFNALGWLKTGNDKFGHSWAIAKREDGKFYVYETTLNLVGTPKIFKGNKNYFADWGIANWSHAGRIVNEKNQI